MKYLFSIIISAAMSLTAAAVTLGDVESMIRSGELAEAAAALDSMAVKLPKSAEVDFFKGKLALAENKVADAKAEFQSAVKKGSNDARLELGEIALSQYLVDEAEEYLEDYRAALAKNKRKKLPDNSGDLSQRISRIRGLLDRVDNIVVVDSIVVDAEEFFKAYRLSAPSGHILAVEEMPREFQSEWTSMAYLSEDGRMMMWADMNNENQMVLRRADSLVGDSWSEAESFAEHLSLGGDANYPFMMPDGVTLYYASDGESSLGGYDIYISRYNGDRFLDPQNLGFPYNSPYDDYLLAIDEYTGIGWWATDRNQIPGCVTIYMFVPEEMRSNVSIEDVNLASRARLDNISATWREDTDRGGILERLNSLGTTDGGGKVEFVFYLPDGRVLTRYDEFSNDMAAQTMERYVVASDRFKATESELRALREAYGRGDRSVESRIWELERRIENERLAVKRLANEVIKAETRQ